MMEITIRISDKTLKIGGILLGAFGVLSLSFYLLASGVFTAKYSLRTYVAEAQGLGTGTLVRLNGIEVGTVASIKLAQNPSGPNRKIELVLRIEKQYENEILSDSVASVVTEGLLGNRYVNIVRGSQGKPLPPEAEIPAVSTTTLSLKEFTQSLATVVDCLNQKKQDTEAKPKTR
jgi:phospholipid/cholesterol/gamma-HCH transport system substrate-binding protein